MRARGRANRQAKTRRLEHDISQPFAGNITRAKDLVRDRACQVLLAFAPVAVGLALAGLYWEAIGVGLIGTGVMALWPSLEPFLARLTDVR